MQFLSPCLARSSSVGTLPTAFNADGAESQLYEVFLVIVNQGNGFTPSLDTINGNAALVRRSVGLQDGDVVYRLPINTRVAQVRRRQCYPLRQKKAIQVTS